MCGRKTAQARAICTISKPNPPGNRPHSPDQGGTISYVYNPEDKIKQITSPSGNTVIGYDDYGYQSSLEDIDAGTIEYTYNAFGEL